MQAITSPLASPLAQINIRAVDRDPPQLCIEAFGYSSSLKDNELIIQVILRIEEFDQTPPDPMPLPIGPYVQGS